LVRESATDGKTAGPGFNRERDNIGMVCELEKWQSSGDQRLWKIILSPEFGDRIDLQRLARDLIGQIEKDLGTDLEWIAVRHHNTEHPHIHMVIRGVARTGEPIHFKREYVKHGIRSIAEEMCTRQLGYRTSRDAVEAERREIGGRRFTSLDRAILQAADKGARSPGSVYFNVVKTGAQPGRNESELCHVNHVIARLAVLQRMGLAASAGPNTWLVRPDLEEVLRAMQRVSDRQRTLAANGVPISDERLPIQVLNMRGLTAVEGRILVRGEDEQSGRNYLMLEGTDAKVHLIYYTPEMEEARSRGELRTNSFVRLCKLFVGGQPTLDIHDFGDAEQAVKNRGLLGERASALLKRGIVPTEDGWGGWLGRFQASLASTAGEILRSRGLGAVRSPDHKQDGSRGR
jgi:type IV secretory pathway VirD2 relaxase